MVRFLAMRRWNVVDLAGIGGFIDALTSGHWLIAMLTMASTIVVSVALEMMAEAR